MTRPSAWDDIAYSLRRYYVDRFHRTATAGLSAGSYVIDIGGYSAGKRGHFDIANVPVRTISVNVSVAKRPTVQGDALALPFADCTFDAAICSEVVEHVPDARALLRETRRVLKPGGRFLLCAPFMYQIHGDPDDFARYTDSYLRRGLVDLGFRVLSVERHGAFWSVIADMLRSAACEHDGRSLQARISRRVLRSIMPAVKRFAVTSDSHVAPGAYFERFTTGFGIIAARSGPPTGTDFARRTTGL